MLVKCFRLIYFCFKNINEIVKEFAVALVFNFEVFQAKEQHL